MAQQETLTLIRARDSLVRLRTAAVNSVRGLAKPCGYRLPTLPLSALQSDAWLCCLPVWLRRFGPLLHQIAEMTVKIKQYDQGDQKADGDFPTQRHKR